MEDITLNKGAVVFNEGDSGDCMYYIRWGSVSVFSAYGTSKQKKLADLSEGDYFGEMGLIDGEPRSATVVVAEKGTILERIGEDEFAQFLVDQPNKVTAIIQQLSHKLRQTTKDYLEVCRSVSNAVGEEATSVDEDSDYRFTTDKRLAHIHSEYAAMLLDA